VSALDTLRAELEACDVLADGEAVDAYVALSAAVRNYLAAPAATADAVIASSSDLDEVREVAARLIAFTACECGDGHVEAEAIYLARQASQYVGP
jgi:aerobic-type carbon monoxide dehydrogenase small subunit (CoxS/CutS family)